MGLRRGCEELANLHTSQTSGFRNCVKGCAHAITTHQAGNEQGGDTWQHLGTVWDVTTRTMGSTDTPVIGARDASKHPTIHRTGCTLVENVWLKMTIQTLRNSLLPEEKVGKMECVEISISYRKR